MHLTRVEAMVYIFIACLALERAAELWISRRNERWLGSKGGKEADAAFSRFIKLFHAGWFALFLFEALVRGGRLRVSVPVLLVWVFLLQGVRHWCIASLGKRWNTKVIALPGAHLVRKGPYRVFPHPNYLVVLIELPLYPGLFGLWITASLFGIANVFVLARRIVAENRLLRSAPTASGGTL